MRGEKSADPEHLDRAGATANRRDFFPRPRGRVAGMRGGGEHSLPFFGVRGVQRECGLVAARDGTPVPRTCVREDATTEVRLNITRGVLGGYSRVKGSLEHPSGCPVAQSGGPLTPRLNEWRP